MCNQPEKVPNKLETNELRMWAVVPEKGFLDDVLAVFKEEGQAEMWARVERKVTGIILVVLPVYVELGLVVDEDNGDSDEQTS